MNFAEFYGFSLAEALVFDATRFGGHLYMFLLVFLDVSAIDLWARKVANFGRNHKVFPLERRRGLFVGFRELCFCFFKALFSATLRLWPDYVSRQLII